LDGEYTFWVAADESAELWLSPDAIPAHARKIAFVDTPVGPQEWDKYPRQRSESMSLIAGRKYSIELLHKEDAGDDHYAVAWQGPGITRGVIEQDCLMPWEDRVYGDLTGNQFVTIDDLELFSEAWLIHDCSLDLDVDINGDCAVNMSDFALAAGNWFKGEVTLLRIQENEAGFVGLDGTVDSNHEGYTGTGFSNTYNEHGSAVTWAVNVPVTGTYILQWRYACGSATHRTGTLLVNGEVESENIDFAATGDWAVWEVTSQISITLTEGVNIIRLRSDTDEGLANIDWIEISGFFPLEIH
jgi:hypothetical protein